MSPVLGAGTASSSSGIVQRGVYYPKGSLDTWKAARDNAASRLVEAVVFGDSTTYGSCSDANMYSWTQDLRAQSVAAGFADGGRGIVYDDVNSGDVAASNGDITTVVSRSNWAVGGATGGNVSYSVTPGPIQNNVAGGTITLQGVCTQIRLHASYIANTTGKLTYSIDGGAATTVDTTSTGFTADTLLIASGLTLGTHTVTLTSLGYGSLAVPTIYLQPSTSTASGSLAAGAYRYQVTGVPATGSGETTPVTTNSATLAGTGTVTFSIADLSPHGATYKVYRQTGGSGSYSYIGSVSGAGGNAHLTFTDDGTATPTGATPPGANTAQDTSIPYAAVNLDFLKSTGIVYHKQATSGISLNSYFSTGNPSFGNYQAQIALGLTPGVASTPATAQFGWASPQAAKPRYRNPSLAVCALGINDMQGFPVPGTNGGTTDVDNANRAVLSAQDMWHNFVRMARQAGADPVIVIPHFTLANNNHYYAGQFTAAAMAIATADQVPVVDFNYLIGQPKDWAGNGVSAAVHSSKAAYQLEGRGLWNLLLSL